jgi:hypothetical protein
MMLHSLMPSLAFYRPDAVGWGVKERALAPKRRGRELLSLGAKLVAKQHQTPFRDSLRKQLKSYVNHRQQWLVLVVGVQELQHNLEQRRLKGNLKRKG